MAMADAATALPAPRRLLADLIHAIAAIPLEAAPTETTADTNTLRRVPPAHRALFATLHVLFPALLMPALDLLDRRRVVRFALPPRRHAPSAADTRAPAALYQIRGDAAQVVHLRSWHCTCAFFALAAVRADRDTSRTALLRSAPRAFSTPPCKHLLACLLAEEWPALHAYTLDGGGTPGTAASPETLAGLVAGVL